VAKALSARRQGKDVSTLAKAQGRVGERQHDEQEKQQTGRAQ
jgi:hypothetical protein